MIRHYFKIAFRNLLKYKTQSIISIIGLAVGITCFALATLWIRYEMTYDTFHRRADDIYLVRAQLTITDGTLSNSMPYPAIEYLRKNISEIEDICGISPFKTNLRFKDKGGDLLAIEVDSAFIRMFDVRILQGNVNFLKKKSNEIAITEAVAKKWFGNENPLGKEIELGSRPCKVCAVVSGWSQFKSFIRGLASGTPPSKLAKQFRTDICPHLAGYRQISSSKKDKQPRCFLTGEREYIR